MLEIDSLTKRYGVETAVEDLSMAVERGEFVTLLGPSGSGKTTTLLSIAGHVTPSAGTIRIDGRDVTDEPPENRSLGVVFQRDALFPHMTARENLVYALGPHGYGDREREERTDRFLSLVGMAGHAEKYPDQLSGGQRRRIELARALAYEPDLLLLDEPLTGLDRGLRREMRAEIARIHAETDVTTIYVTHDQEEALTLSDRIFVLDGGRPVAEGTPRNLYEQPPNPFVASFLGTVSKLPATVVGAGEADPDSLAVEWCGFRFVLDGDSPGPDSDGDGLGVGDRLPLYVRPEAVKSSLVGDGEPRDVTVEARVEKLTHGGARSTVLVETPDCSPLRLTADGFPELERGDRIEVGFDAEAPFAFVGPDRLRVVEVVDTPEADGPTYAKTEEPAGHDGNQEEPSDSRKHRYERS